MAKINRLSGIIRGKIGDEVYYGLGGEQRVRKAAGGYKIKNTRRWINIKAILGELSSAWRELPENTKALWELYAKTLGKPHQVEKNKNVSYRLCPIPSYPPRPKNICGKMAFISANCRGYYAGMEPPLLRPPLGVSIPPAPCITSLYDHESGELVVKLESPNIIKADSMKVRKAFIWLTAFRSIRGRCAIVVCKQLFDTFDIPPNAKQIVERRYTGIKDTWGNYGYRAILFSDMPYLRIYIGAQVVIAPDLETAPVISSGSYLPYWILNKPRYIGIEDLLLAGEFRQPGQIKFGDRFKRRVQRLRNKLAKSKFKVR